jgi:hypothetical protein
MTQVTSVSTRVAVIIIGTFKENWWQLSPIARADFVDQVAKTATAAGMEPMAGYRLTSTPGAFLEVWEGADDEIIERAIKALQAMGYAQYVEARWLIGEREIVPVTAKQEKKSTRTTAVRRSPRRRR